MPGATPLIRIGASSGVRARTKPSTAHPVQLTEIMPGLHFLAGVPETSVIEASSTK